MLRARAHYVSLIGAIPVIWWLGLLAWHVALGGVNAWALLFYVPFLLGPPCLLAWVARVARNDPSTRLLSLLFATASSGAWVGITAMILANPSDGQNGMALVLMALGQWALVGLACLTVGFGLSAKR